MGLLPLLGMGLVTATWDSQLAAITAGAVMVALAWLWWSRSGGLPGFDHPWVTAAVLAGLLVHLLASGGIGMPGIVQLMLLACLFSVTGRNHSMKVPSRFSEGMHLGTAVCLTITTVLLVRFGLVPMANATTLVGAGEVETYLRNNSAKAVEYYSLAAEADPWDPLPWNRRAALAIAQWDSARTNRNQLMHEAAELQSKAIARDPRNPRLRYELGAWYWQAFQRDADPEHLQFAIEWLRQATDGYPNSSMFQSTMALALQAKGDVDNARHHAQQALDLDQLNRAAGHTDKLLPEDVHQELLILLENSAETPFSD